MAAEEEVQVIKLLMGPYDNNCYVLIHPGAGESIIIDAPSEADVILSAVGATKVQRIVITHSHRDHWGALEEVKARTGAPVSYHPAEANTIPISADIPIEDGALLPLGPSWVKVLHTPGHTPGSLCLLVGNNLISGDTLFPGGPGHSRTPEALYQTVESIREKLFPLPDDTIVYPGHGQEAILRSCKAEYAVFASRSHDPDLCGDVLWLES